MAVSAWRDDYPWLQLAFRQTQGTGRALSEEWRWRIEEDLKAQLDYRVRADGTAAVWCGLLSRHDFPREPTPKALLDGLDDAYRMELERRGWPYPDLSGGATGERGGTVTVVTRSGPVEISWAVRDALVALIRERGSGDFVVRIFEAVGSSRPVNLDRKGKIVVLDALWGLSDDVRADPQLGELQDKLKDEITAP